MGDELGGQIVKKIFGLRAKIYNYLRENENDENNKTKGTKTCTIKRELKFQDYKNCSKLPQIENIIERKERG